MRIAWGTNSPRPLSERFSYDVERAKQNFSADLPLLWDPKKGPSAFLTKQDPIDMLDTSKMSAKKVKSRGMKTLNVSNALKNADQNHLAHY